MRRLAAAFLLSYLYFCALPASAETVRFRSGIFLHHSTGACIWGPQGTSTSVPIEMARYNQAHGYQGAMAVGMSETWYPATTDNEWWTWHTIFETGQPESIAGYYAGNRIIMIKSCFPASALEGTGSPADSTSPWVKTLANYKWHWRHIVRVMQAHPDNVFIIWTNAPLERLSTTPAQGHLSELFCTWAADTLARGLDPALPAFPPNVFVFDFFHRLVGADGIMRDQYRASPGDSHPNAAATNLVAPQLVAEVFDHAIAYEAVYGHPTAVPGTAAMPARDAPIRAWPNPSSDRVSFQLPPDWGARTLEAGIYDVDGRLVGSLVPCGPGSTDRGDAPARIEWNGLDSLGRPVAAGVYFLRLTAGKEATGARFVRAR